MWQWIWCIGDEGPLAKLNRFDSPPLFSHHIFFSELRKQHAESGDKRVWSMDGSIFELKFRTHKNYTTCWLQIFQAKIAPRA